MSSRSQIEKRDCSPERTGRTFKRMKLEDRNQGNEMIRPKTLSREDYTVGWISALSLEEAAAAAMLDEIHGNAGQLETDNNTYTFGSMAGHNCVIACLPAGVYGHTSATIVASHMGSSFPSIRFWLLVGIGGGAPTEKVDIRLGDVVVSTPTPQTQSPGVIQYDYGKMIGDGVFERTGTLNKPPPLLLTAISTLQARHRTEAGSRILALIDEMTSKHPEMRARYGPRDPRSDVLFKADYDHEKRDNCQNCDRTFAVTRPERQSCGPVVHYGTIGSANELMRDATVRDRLAKDIGILCFEMEAAGLVDNFPCLTIRGICDYADSHKSKEWQEFAAATAAAYAKELLGVISPPALRELRTHLLPTSALEHRRLCLKALDFDHREQRGFAIKEAFSETCTWLLGRHEYQKWLDSRLLHEHNGFLWIKGNPGTGKSTLMKFALKNTKQNSLASGAIVISFFFNARGDELEKSATGMYRSLLFQLFNLLPRLQTILDSEVTQSMLNSGNWSLECLQHVFRLVIRNLKQQPLICFIDAVDECDESEVRDMVDYFGEIGELAASSLIPLHVCLSSRHYPHVTFDKGLEMILEGQDGHGNDISYYLDRKLASIKHKEIPEVKAEIIEKASGIFLWVVLVVDILKKAYDHGRMRAVRKRLREIPPELKDLFKDILTRDEQNMEDLLLCLNWILYANRPLSPHELFYAVQSHNENELDPIELEDDVDSVSRFILSSSKGLVEVTKSRRKTIVQFIHESVRDFLLKEGGLDELWRAVHASKMVPGHEDLKVGCWNYLTKAYIVREGILPDDLPRAKTEEAAALREKTSNSLPFLDYAVNNVLQHAEAAEQAGVSQTDFLSQFDTYQWTYMYNLFEKHQNRRYARRTRLTYILAERNLSHLLKSRLEATPVDGIFNNCECRYCGSCRHLDDENSQRWASPFQAAMAKRNEQVIRVLFTTRCTSYATQGEDLADLISRLSELKVPEVLTIFQYAVMTGDLPIQRLILSTGRVDLSTARAGRKTPLMLAVENRKVFQLIAVLDLGADPNEQMSGDPAMNSPLSTAVRMGETWMVYELLRHGADPNIGQPDYCLLREAVMTGSLNITEQLLQAGARANGYMPTLHHAARWESVGFARLLLQRGAYINYQDEYGWTALHWAKTLEICEFLVDGGADLNIRDNEGRTPIFSLDYEKVQLLLRRGAQVNIKDNKGHTPLMRVVYLHEPEIRCKRAGSWRQIIRLLLDNGANPKECKPSRSTALAITNIGNLGYWDRIAETRCDDLEVEDSE